MQEKESFLDHTQEIQINDGDLKDLDLETSKKLEKQLSVIKYDKYDLTTEEDDARLRLSNNLATATIGDFNVIIYKNQDFTVIETNDVVKGYTVSIDENTPIRTINPFRSPGKPAKDLIAYRKNRKRKNKAAKKSRKINRKNK